MAQRIQASFYPINGILLSPNQDEALVADRDVMDCVIAQRHVRLEMV